MRKLAVLYDIHGNLAALDAVVAEAEAAVVEGYVLGGDYATFGPWPRETVERLEELPVEAWVRGNVDRWLVEPPEVPEAARPLVEAAGAHYVCTRDLELSELGRFDLVAEAAGNAKLMAQTLGLLRRSGVACLLGLDPRKQTVELDGPVLGVDAVLENRVLFGSVNAQRQDWLAGVSDLARAHERWPDALEQFVALRVPLDRFAEAFDYRGSKATLVLSE